MERQAELRAERDALEAELLALEQVIQLQWPQGAAVPAELAQRVEDLLGRLKLVNKALSELGGSTSD
jgi:hypothetical protein